MSICEVGCLVGSLDKTNEEIRFQIKNIYICILNIQILMSDQCS